MKEKRWFLITEDFKMVGEPLSSLEEAKELYDKLNGSYKEYIICETIYG